MLLELTKVWLSTFLTLHAGSLELSHSSRLAREPSPYLGYFAVL